MAFVAFYGHFSLPHIIQLRTLNITNPSEAESEGGLADSKKVNIIWI